VGRDAALALEINHPLTPSYIRRGHSYPGVAFVLLGAGWRDMSVVFELAA